MTPVAALTRPTPSAPLHCDAGPEKACGCGADETCAQRNGRRLTRLEAIADMGVDIARGAHSAHQALPPAGTAEGSTPEVTEVREALNLAFTRVARIVERVSQLEARLHATGGALVLNPRPPAQPGSPPKSPEQARADTIDTRKIVVGIDIELAIKDEADPDEEDDLLLALHNRLHHGPDSDDFADLPHEVMVARVCHDLDLPRDWAIWTEECCPLEVGRLDREKVRSPP